MVQDVVTTNEQSVFNNYTRDIATAKLANKVHKDSARKAVARYFPSKGSKSSKGKRPEFNNWRPPKSNIEQSATVFLRKHAPGPATIVVHERNGAWELGYPGFLRKSVAWTKRGYAKAIAVSLLHLWRLHEEQTMEELPSFLSRVREIADGPDKAVDK